MEVNNAVKTKISADVNGEKMAFDRFHNTGTDSYYSPDKNDFTEDNGGPCQPFTTDLNTDFSLNLLPYNTWSTQDDPNQLINSAQGIPPNRNLIDGNDCRSEADLYGLVSTILEEVDPMDFSQEKSPGLRNVWSPKAKKEDNSLYPNCDINMQSSSGSQHSRLCPEPINKTPTQPAGRDYNQSTDIYQHFNGFDAADPTWLFSTCNGDSESYTPLVQNLKRPPPGLSIPLAVSSFMSKSRPGKSELGMPGKQNSFCSSSNALSENTDSCCLPNKMNDSFFSMYQDFSLLGRSKIGKSRPFSVQDANKLTNDMQAVLMGEQVGVYNGEPVEDSPMRVQDENMVHLNSLPFQRMSAFVSPAPHVKEMTLSVREQRAGEVGNKTQLLQSDYTTNDFSGFGLQSDLFQAAKSFTPPFGFPTSHQGKEVDQRETRAPQTSLSQYHNGQLNQYKSQPKLAGKASFNTDTPGISKLMSQSVAEFVPSLSSQQMQGPPARILKDFEVGDELTTQGRIGQAGLGLGLEGLRKVAGSGDFNLQQEKSRQQTGMDTVFMVEGNSSQWFGAKPKPPIGFQRETEKKQGLLENPYQMLGSIYAGQTRHNGTGSNQANSAPSQVLPYLYQAGDPRQNLCHLLSSRSPLAYGSSVPLTEMSELLPDGEFPTLNPYLQELTVPGLTGGDGPFPGFLSNMRSQSLGKSLGAPMSQLHYYLEECYEQWRMMEKERKMTESLLMKSYPGKRVSAANSNSLPKMPLNPSRVDRLIVDQLREQTKVVSLLGKMERLRSFPLHANISSVLDRHLEAIYVTQARRKDELNRNSRQRQGPAYLREDREVLLLASALKDLIASTRKSRTAVWCALQMTLPKTNTSPDDGAEASACLPSGQHSPDQIAPDPQPLCDL
ncbi:meiosis-specific coiled-coil domain-containing protein MEIOC [Electrophorus electricus]|uniref:meiosis-specific coiled-coil domain-containing protein MEIOC n=1 Tax=Electrophorus electricus TaxID=8005 RepID=UPI0015D05C81|nr:meiosis-specific coiled-coil domain-containing protein MEIOC [Electrophorus electricus]